ncbi:MAG: porin family protein [Methylococcales bacterium]|nr:porin family protein [Methylococcales bacterium]
MKKNNIAASVAAVLAISGAVVSAPVAAEDSARVEALEAQVQQMSSMLRALRNELNQVRVAASETASDNDAKVQELDQWMASVKSSSTSFFNEKNNMVFFRGGFGKNDNDRTGVSIASAVAPTTSGQADRGDQDAWYIGAGFDFSLDDDLFGLMDNTEVLAELMFEYKHFDSNANGNALATNPTPLLQGVTGSPVPGTARDITISQLSLTAAPKIKFMKGSDFRPWIIPFGLGIHIISPPSESITVLNPGMMFGGGADYKVWDNIYIGMDGRYHLTSGDGDGVNTDGFTAGGYIGIGF